MNSFWTKITDVTRFSKEKTFKEVIESVKNSMIKCYLLFHLLASMLKLAEHKYWMPKLFATKITGFEFINYLKSVVLVLLLILVIIISEIDITGYLINQ